MENITKEEYEKALVRLEELLPLVGNDCPADDENMIGFTELILINCMSAK